MCEERTSFSIHKISTALHCFQKSTLFSSHGGLEKIWKFHVVGQWNYFTWRYRDLGRDSHSTSDTCKIWKFSVYHHRWLALHKEGYYWMNFGNSKLYLLYYSAGPNTRPMKEEQTQCLTSEKEPHHNDRRLGNLHEKYFHNTLPYILLQSIIYFLPTWLSVIERAQRQGENHIVSIESIVSIA